ncbi:hypothetical protein DXB19_10310 [Lachnospiraceae bacterium OM02-26]|jgi:hypothetical protein|nr:hypothetical protein DXB19_10310 [Lachnospiraceae bacterium OM02-26]
MAINIPLVHISDLTEKKTISDDDYMLTGGSTASKVKWSTIVSLIKTKLGIGNIEDSISKIQSDISTLNSDLTNKLRNIVIKTSGSGTSISVTISNYDNLKSKSDKIALFLFGNGNGLSRCAIISINISGEDIIIDATTNVVSENISCSASKNVITINGLPQWGFYTVIAPPNVYIDQGGIVFDN